MSANLFRGRSATLPAPLGSISGKARARQRRQRLLRLSLLAITLAFVTILLAAPPVRLRRACRRALHWYLRVLHSHPLVARALSAGVIFFVADLAAQRLSNSEAPFCYTRLARYSVYGATFMGPFLWVWYSLMNEYGPGDDLAGSLQKCIFEQITLEPLCIIFYILYDGLMLRRGWGATLLKLETMFLSLWFKNGVFWIPANFFNYYIGTPDLRVVFANLCSLFWNAYFSTKINNIAQGNAAVKSPSARTQGGGAGKYKLLPDGDMKV